MIDQQSLLIDPTKIYSEVPEIPEEFTNDYGSIRRCKVLSEYNVKNINLKEVVDLYRDWRDDPEYFILRGLLKKSTDQQRLISVPLTEFDDSWYTADEYEYLYKFIKASKRGNDVYKHLVTQKLKQINELYNVKFFDEHVPDKRTCCLFVTLTYDNKICDIEEAWKRIGKEFHLFHNNLRKAYGRVEVFRTWESTNHYYPHVHACIVFWEKDFIVLEHKDKNGEISYRIPYSEKKKISEYWHSNIDIQAVQDTDGGIKELTKYITKDLCSEKGDKTNAMIWLYGKQSYGISKGFMDAVKGWHLDWNEPTNADLINQMCNCNQDVVNWEFIGILRGKHLGFSSSIWCVDLKKPPPRVINLVIQEQKRWSALHGGKY